VTPNLVKIRNTWGSAKLKGVRFFAGGQGFSPFQLPYHYTLTPDCLCSCMCTANNARCYFPSGTDKYTRQELFSVPILIVTLLTLTLTLTLTIALILPILTITITPRTENSLEQINYLFLETENIICGKQL